MAKPEFSFEASDPADGKWSLVLRVKAGEKETSWKIKYRTTNQQLYQIFGEIMMELDPLERIPPEQALRATQKPVQSPEVVPDEQMSEAGSAELRAAKARAVEKTGKTWFSNMEDEDELPLYNIGHGEAQ